MTPLRIVVTVGSDHHPFNRLIEWMDAWMLAQDPGRVSCVFQYGTAATPRTGESYDFLPHHELEQLMRDADVVVTQGGPMGVLEARRYGTRPVAVPRLAQLGEVVDDHQVAFCRHLAELGTLAIAEDATALSSALTLAVSHPQYYAIEPNAVDGHVQETVARFAELVAGLSPRAGVLSLRR